MDRTRASRTHLLPLKVLVAYSVLFYTGCGVFQDPATAFVSCINAGADRMRSTHRAESRVLCRAREGHTVTVFLQPRSSSPLTEAEVEDLRRRGIPEDALFYRGPDSPSIGNRALPRPGVAVSVYDGSYPDNRRYSDAYGLQRDIEIAGRFVRTGTDFVVSLRRNPAERIEVVDLR